MVDTNAAPPTLASQVQPYAVAALTVIASAVAAWFAGKSSVGRELEKVAKQRAFELRLEWYKKVIAALGDFQTYTLEFLEMALRADSDKEEDKEALKALHSKTADSMNALHIATREALLFGSPATVKALTAMVSALNRMPGTGISKDEIKAGKEEADHTLELAYLALAADMRHHLGSETLEAEDMQVVFRPLE